MNWIKKELLSEAKKAASNILQRSLDKNVKLAVTGLSRSGKTAFITSLIHQLLHANDSKSLPLFVPANNGQWLGAKLLSQEHFEIASFPYQKNIESLLADKPAWPESTRTISELRLAIRYRPSSFLEQKLLDKATLTLDIIDYPGEWLLDLPMLNWSFQDWSRAMYKLNASDVRQKLGKEWLNLLSTYSYQKTYSESEIDIIVEKYTAYLFECKRKHYGLSLVQPGRFVLPGELEGAPLLKFFPLPLMDKTENELKKLPEDGLYRILEKRYENYKKHVVEPFYHQHFRHFDRQVVLVDCLQALNDGCDSFSDMHMAISWLLKNFQYGRSNFIKRLISPKVNKLIFTATKSDCVTPNQHHNLTEFLKKMVAKANNDVKFEGIDTSALSVASVNCTKLATGEFQGQKVSCLKGVRADNEEEVAIFPGEVPSEMPNPEDWIAGRFKYVDFKPPSLPNKHNKILPHIRMDRILQELIGDKF
ncbi:MAG: YcjX family protein [Pseudomonadota bacterium]